MIMWNSHSSSSNKEYESIHADDGKLLCNCPGWTMRRGDQPRLCKHLKKYVKLWRYELDIRGEFVYAPTTTTTKLAPAPEPEAATRIIPSPMLCGHLDQPTEATFAPFAEGGWFMEEKFDGHRILIEVHGQSVTAYSRPKDGLRGVRAIPNTIADQMRQLGNGFYDGELMVPGGISSDVTKLGAALHYRVFDILQHGDVDVMSYPLVERRFLLEHLFSAVALTVVQLSELLPVRWSVIDDLWKSEREGVILKKATSRYVPGDRSRDWIKVKTVGTAVLTIVGFLPGSAGPHSVTKLRSLMGLETTVKTGNLDIVRQIDANPEAWIGKRLRISHNGVLKSGLWRHPMWDHLPDEGDHRAPERL